MSVSIQKKLNASGEPFPFWIIVWSFVALRILIHASKVPNELFQMELSGICIKSFVVPGQKRARLYGIGFPGTAPVEFVEP